MRYRESPVDALIRNKPLGLKPDDSAYRVVVIDDSIMMRKIVSRSFRAEGFEICAEGSTGEEAIAIYKEHMPDLMSMDINMPLVSGIEALQRILAFDPNACIVMLTSEADKHTVMKAIALGARGYIVKPPERVAVNAALKRALKI